MDPSILAKLLMVKQMEKENYNYPMEIFIRENFLIISWKGKVYIIIKLGQSTKGNL